MKSALQTGLSIPHRSEAADDNSFLISLATHVFFPLNGLRYYSVCERVLGYQKGTTEAFWPLVDNSIESSYVAGVSLTHGSGGSRQHIWTFAAAVREQDPDHYRTDVNCACTNTQYNWSCHQLPSFIGNNYFCDTGFSGPGTVNDVYFTDDPLWDGKGCGPFSTCCQFNSPPWFQTTLLQTTSDDIELRLCFAERIREDVILYLIDIYVR